MGDLDLTLLGPPEVRHGDQVLLFSTRKELALLLHLRHLLGEGADVSPVPHLLIQRDTLGLDPTSDIELDLHILHEACCSWQRLAARAVNSSNSASMTILCSLLTFF